MDDMQTFERRVATEVVRGMGPSEPVDDAAILTAITATQSPKWRPGSMFSATNAITAGALGLVVTIGLLLARPSAEVQDAAPAAQGAVPSPVVVEGTITFDTEVTAPTVNSVLETNLLEYRGWTEQGLTVEISDARLEGTATLASNLDVYRGSGTNGTVSIFTGVVRIENDDGAWQSHPTVGVGFADGSATVNTIVLEGEDAYEGLTAVLEVTQGLATGGAKWTVAGAIIGGDPPPTPAEPEAGLR